MINMSYYSEVVFFYAPALCTFKRNSCEGTQTIWQSFAMWFKVIQGIPFCMALLFNYLRVVCFIHEK